MEQNIAKGVNLKVSGGHWGRGARAGLVAQFWNQG